MLDHSSEGTHVHRPSALFDAAFSRPPPGVSRLKAASLSVLTTITERRAIRDY